MPSEPGCGDPGLVDPDLDERERDTDALARFVSRRLVPGQSAHRAWAKAAGDAGEGISFRVVAVADHSDNPGGADFGS
jgi:hypothetical protein